MKTVEFGDFVYECPQKFSELTAEQLRVIATAVANHYPLAEGKLFMASKWFPEAYAQLNKYLLMDKKLAEKGKASAVENFLQTTQDLNALAQLTDWVHEVKHHVTPKWLIPEITVNGTTYLGPTDKFANVEFWEYCKADTHFSRHQTTKNLNEFSRFIACLYRLPNTDAKEVERTGNSRVQFNDKLILKDAANFISIDPVTRVSIILNYVSIKNWLMGVFPEVLRKRDTGDANGNSTHSDIGRLYGKLLLSIAKRRHQDEEVIARKPLLLVFEDQNDEIERYNEQKEYLNSLKR